MRAFKHAVFPHLQIQARPGLVVPYVPHPGQAKIHFPDEEWNRFICRAGQRSGKTLAAAAEGIVMLGIENTRGWITAPTYDLTDRCFEVIYKAVVVDRVYDRIMGITDSVVRSHNTKMDRVIEMKWGSWIKGKSADSPKSLVGEQLDYIIYDECANLPKKIWESYLEPRLMNRKGWCLFISSPGPQNWFWDFYSRGGREDGWGAASFKTTDNPYIDREYYDRVVSLLTDPVRKREYEGEFVHFEGLVYPGFMDAYYPEGHIFEPSDERFKVDQFDSHYRSIDIATGHETGAVWGAVKQGNDGFFKPGDLVIYQDYWERHPSHMDHAQEIRSRTRYPIVSTVISHDATRVNPRTNDDEQFKSVKDVYADVGIFTQKAITDVSAGIEAVSQYLQATRQDHPLHPRIFISKRCNQLRYQFGNYVYKETADGEPTEKPRKKHDDLMDAIRYLTITRPDFAPWSAEAEDRYDTVTRYGYKGTPFARRKDESYSVPGMASVPRF